MTSTTATATEAPSGFDLTGRTALVTGGGRGLGKAIARGLALAGADVVITGRTERDLAAGLEEILAGTTRSGRYLTADLRRQGAADRVARDVLGQVGRVDILVSNAGVNVQQPLEEVTDEAWDEVLGVFVYAAMALSRALVGPMKERRWGRLIYISSVLGLKGLANRAAYSAAKAGLIGMARTLAVELGPHGITANRIAPGPFATDAMTRLGPAEAEVVNTWTALGRPGRPEEMVGPVLLLASDAGAYITGSTLVVDGGWLIK
jgi:NAD(P)-dependent dehydrogenase (short-subunit alcohol dehydrogenase family)